MFKMLFTLALRCIWIISSGLVTIEIRSTIEDFAFDILIWAIMPVSVRSLLVHAGKEAPPWGKEATPRWKEAPPPRKEAHPPGRKHPPGIRSMSAGTHPTGIHSCSSERSLMSKYYLGGMMK